MKQAIEFYSKELTENFDNEVKALLNGKGIFRLLTGGYGTGKTASVYRQANLKNWEVVEFNPADDLNDRKDELKAIVMGYNSRPVVLLFDAIDKIKLPDWFFSYSDDKRKNRNSFMSIAMRKYKTGNFVLIATATQYWTVHPELRKMFVEVKTNLNRFIIKRHIKQHGAVAGNNFPIDLRTMHELIRDKDAHIERPYDVWTEFRRFFTEKPRYNIPDIHPPFVDWVLANLLNGNPTAFPNKHHEKFYQMIATICLADLHKDPEILKGLPMDASTVWMNVYRPMYKKK